MLSQRQGLRPTLRWRTTKSRRKKAHHCGKAGVRSCVFYLSILGRHQTASTLGAFSYCLITAPALKNLRHKKATVRL